LPVESGVGLIRGKTNYADFQQNGMDAGSNGKKHARRDYYDVEWNCMCSVSISRV
jgi:hypothetical protein